jgi:ABC-type multidrug transport system ATPase subunit
VTHAVDFLHLVDRVIVMESGRVVMDGSYEEIKESEYLQKLAQIHQANTGIQESEEEGQSSDEIEEEEKHEDDGLEQEVKPKEKGKMIMEENEEESKVTW